VVSGKVTEGLVTWCGWHGMQEVRGSNPLSSTLLNSQVRGLRQLEGRIVVAVLRHLGPPQGRDYLSGCMRSRPMRYEAASADR
jgi:hypothetical protein